MFFLREDFGSFVGQLPDADFSTNYFLTKTGLKAVEWANESLSQYKKVRIYFSISFIFTN